MRVLIALIAGVALLSAAPAHGAAKKTVNLGDNYYTPEALKVKRGTTVTWKWPGFEQAGDVHDVKLMPDREGTDPRTSFEICERHPTQFSQATILLEEDECVTRERQHRRLRYESRPFENEFGRLELLNPLLGHLALTVEIQSSDVAKRHDARLKEPVQELKVTWLQLNSAKRIPPLHVLQFNTRHFTRRRELVGSLPS